VQWLHHFHHTTLFVNNMVFLGLQNSQHLFHRTHIQELHRRCFYSVHQLNNQLWCNIELVLDEMRYHIWNLNLPHVSMNNILAWNRDNQSIVRRLIMVDMTMTTLNASYK